MWFAVSTIFIRCIVSTCDREVHIACRGVLRCFWNPAIAEPDMENFTFPRLDAHHVLDEFESQVLIILRCNFGGLGQVTVPRCPSSDKLWSTPHSSRLLDSAHNWAMVSDDDVILATSRISKPKNSFCDEQKIDPEPARANSIVFGKLAPHPGSQNVLS